MGKELQLFLFTLASTIVVILSLIIVNKYVKKEKNKNAVFITVAVLTVLLHYSSVFYSLIIGQPVELIDTYYLPVYPCNVIMWENLIIAILLIFNKRGKVFNVLANAVFFTGIICAFVGIAFNTNFLNTPSFSDFDILKGLLSHVTLLFCCIYIYTGKYFRIKGLENYTCIVIQAFVFAFCGIYTNTMKDLLGQDSINSMLLQGPPFENLPFINWYTCLPVVLIVYFLITYSIKKLKQKKINNENNKILKGENR